MRSLSSPFQKDKNFYMVNIALIIPVFNNIKYTRKCLEDLSSRLKEDSLKNTGIHIVVVDDGSTDGTGKFISQNYPEVILLKGDGNLWWSGSVNMGMKYALDRGDFFDYVLWWNNDIINKDDYFVQLDDVLHKKSYEILGSKICRLHQPDIIWSMGGVFNNRNGVKYMIGNGATDGPDYSKQLSVDWLTGMGTLVHLSVIKKIGLLDNVNFPQYHGDSEYTYRARKNNLSVVIEPKLVLYNDTSNTGIKKKDSFKDLINMMTSIRSNYHIGKDFKFYWKYARSPLAYIFLVKRYGKLIGGFFKWKIVSTFKVSKA